MIRSKDLFIQLAESLFYKNQLGFLDFDKPTPEEYEVEEFEVEKGNHKTIITFKFNKHGYPVSHGYRIIPLDDGKKDEKRIEQG